MKILLKSKSFSCLFCLKLLVLSLYQSSYKFSPCAKKQLIYFRFLCSERSDPPPSEAHSDAGTQGASILLSLRRRRKHGGKRKG